MNSLDPGVHARQDITPRAAGSAVGRPAALLLALALAGCSRTQTAHSAGPAEQPAMPVTVATVVRKTVPVEVRAIGNVIAYSTVSVKSRIAGQLIKVSFKEGQDVQKGELLFTIDPRPLQAVLKQAEANLARDEYQAKNAEADAARFEALFKQGIIARQQFDQYRSNADALRAQIGADQAAVESARVQLTITNIVAPIDGRAGNLLIHEGNMIKDNDAPMVVINQVQPIFVGFAVPQMYLPEIKQRMAVHTLPVRAVPKEAGSPPETGELSFVDNAIDVSTGTIQLKATFGNERRSLWPGQFVDVVLQLSAQPNALLVPSEAVQNGQRGTYVYVVKTDATVESRPVKVGRTVAGSVVIEQGLRDGETVVTDGQLRLAPGAKVRAKS
jgi:multidrug efflux system membrane fusion protein